ncbi:hypothetical protein CBR_g23537 [Chara braunii]|uniref:Pentacotripeptide-repeat region of PRORP domain-containing protein n=1 Tax=Chara braunii TaxID=69332 RepID=A0A388L4H7_CHABU|nr:hypothetical protein CBR_g23537 [Chara braunii]|eukprot:GBG77210.1 hypothetical protein CBR_g23537 [Chara braunii]
MLCSPQDGLQADQTTYAAMIDVMGRTQQWENLEKLLCAIATEKLPPDDIICRSVVEIYGRAGRFEKMEELLQMLQERRAVDESNRGGGGAAGTARTSFEWSTYHAMAEVYGAAKRWDDVARVVGSCQRELGVLEMKTLSLLVDALGQAREYQSMQGLLEMFEDQGTRPNWRLYAVLLEAFAKQCDNHAGLWQFAASILNRTAKGGATPGRVSVPSGDLERARCHSILGAMCKRFIDGVPGLVAYYRSRGWVADLSAYRLILEGYGARGMVDEALAVYEVIRHEERKRRAVFSKEGDDRNWETEAHPAAGQEWMEKVGHGTTDLEGNVGRGRPGEKRRQRGYRGEDEDYEDYEDADYPECKDEVEADEGGESLCAKETGQAIGMNRASYNFLIDSCCKSRRMQDAWMLVKDMEGRGMDLHQSAIHLFMNGYAAMGMWDQVENLMSLMKERGLQANNRSYAFLVDAYCNAGRIEDAKRVSRSFHAVGHRDLVVMQNTMVRLYGWSGDIERARSTYRGITATGAQRNQASYMAMLDAATNLGRMDIVLEVAKDMQASRSFVGNVIFTALLNACKKCGSWEDWKLVVNSMTILKFPDEVVQFVVGKESWAGDLKKKQDNRNGKQRGKPQGVSGRKAVRALPVLSPEEEEKERELWRTAYSYLEPFTRIAVHVSERRALFNALVDSLWLMGQETRARAVVQLGMARGLYYSKPLQRNSSVLELRNLSVGSMQVMLLLCLREMQMDVLKKREMQNTSERRGIEGGGCGGKAKRKEAEFPDRLDEEGLMVEIVLSGDNWEGKKGWAEIEDALEMFLRDLGAPFKWAEGGGSRERREKMLALRMDVQQWLQEEQTQATLEFVNGPPSWVILDDSNNLNNAQRFHGGID